MRIELSNTARERVESVKQEYLERGLKRSEWEAIMSEVIASVSDSEWARLVEKFTPDSYYLKMALRDDKMAAEIAEMVRKNKNPPAKRGRKPGKVLANKMTSEGPK